LTPRIRVTKRFSDDFFDCKTRKALAEQLLQQNEQDASVTAMDAMLDAARRGQLSDDQCFRLFARLWTLKRLMYYVYGGWAQGINLNEYPPAVAVVVSPTACVGN
jgi:hypothetical protein